jgi:hypothetical protein
MTNLTVAILATNEPEDLHIEPAGKDDTWGFWITLGEYHRPIVTMNDLPYKSREAAVENGNLLVAECKEIYFSPQQEAR